MIVIIKRGTKKIVKCEKCGCEFSYEEEDIKHLENHNGNYSFCSGIRPGYKSYVICPQCSHDFVVNQTREVKVKSGVNEESEDKNE